MTRRALITGITGQDGSYLAELLTNKGYEVHGMVRRTSMFNRARIDRFYEGERGGRLLHYGDLTDTASINRVIREVQPDEIYHLGAQSHVKISFEVPKYTSETIAFGALRLLEAMRDCKSQARLYNASSSEMFGGKGQAPQNEQTPFAPRSPYAIAKVYAHHMCVNYREAYGMYICNGILGNHESPRRGENFVTRKISLGVAGIKLGVRKKLVLGNLDARRDWGFAGDYVEAMWLMLQQDKPDDYVVATGEQHSVREFCDAAFSHVGLKWQQYVEVDARYMRPTEVDMLVGDASKARRVLGWQPRVRFHELVQMMVDADMEELRARY